MRTLLNVICILLSVFLLGAKSVRTDDASSKAFKETIKKTFSAEPSCKPAKDIAVYECDDNKKVLEAAHECYLQLVEMDEIIGLVNEENMVDTEEFQRKDTKRQDKKLDSAKRNYATTLKNLNLLEKKLEIGIKQILSYRNTGLAAPDEAIEKGETEVMTYSCVADVVDEIESLSSLAQEDLEKLRKIKQEYIAKYKKLGIYIPALADEKSKK